MTNKFETKKLFWKIVNTVTEQKDMWVRNMSDELEEEGMVLPSGASVTFVLKTGDIRIYDKNNNIVTTLKEDSPLIFIIKELLEQVEEI